MSKTKKIVLLSILGALVIGYLVGVRVFYKEFLPNTYLHGVNIGTMTEEEAVDTLTKAVHPTFDVVEMDGVTAPVRARLSTPQSKKHSLAGAFLFPLQKQIFRGVAQLGARDIWEREQTSQHRKIKSAKKPCNIGIFRTLQNLQKA